MKRLPKIVAYPLIGLASLALWAVLAVSCFGQSLAFKAVICPPNWIATISQRYDTRDKFDWIVSRVWITRCV